MKQINYILALFLCLFFFSCEKDESIVNNGNEGNDYDEYYINPKDTAGIIVPEGHSLVYFPGGGMMTRAGSETRISHLQYIIYQEDKNVSGKYIFYKQLTVSEGLLDTWPITGIATTVLRGHNYIAVFLGNVDKSLFGNQKEDLLTGVGAGQSLEDAHIKLPSVEFTNTNMYYFAKSASFNTAEDTNIKVTYVPITLKRIVNRTDITKAGLSGGYLEGVSSKDTFTKAYWKQLIKEKLTDAIFLSENGAFKDQVAEGVKWNLIYPLIYCVLKDSSTPAEQENNYSSIKAYNKEWTDDRLNQTQKTNIGETCKTYQSIINMEFSNNIFIQYAQYLYGLFYEDKDNVTLKGILKRIYDDNIPNKSGTKTIDAAIDKVVEAFTMKYTSGLLLPWRNQKYYSGSVETSTTMPGAIDFNLDIDNAQRIAAGKMSYRIQTSSDYSLDNYLSVVTLGEPATSVNRLGISGISLSKTSSTTINSELQIGYPIPNSRFEAGFFHRNRRTVAKQIVESVSLTNPRLTLDTYKQQIEVNITPLLTESMKARESGGDTSGWNIQIGGDYGFTIKNVSLNVAAWRNIQTDILHMLIDKYSNSEYQHSDKALLSFPFVTFKSPDVSSTNIADGNIKTTWSVQEIE